MGRTRGRVASPDGEVDVQLVVPKELGGPGGAGTNPEQLFAAGYAGCFHSALKLVARGQKIDLSESAVTVRVGLGVVDGKFDLTVEIEGEMPGVPADQAKELIEAAHRACPYSNATRGNVDVTLSVVSDQ